MRQLILKSALLAIVGSFSVQAALYNCITINHDVKNIEQLAESGQYRTLAKSSKTLSFDYQSSASFEQYLNYAKAKISNENPKAAIKCPIETVVTKALNKLKNDLTVSDLVAPFELKAENNDKAILLIHGLTDSPYLFHDLASLYQQHGFNVRTLLLPGHGTAPEALVDVDYHEWQQVTEFAIKRTLQDFNQVYLGGFSTGGALILDNLLANRDNVAKVKGVMLWAPASKAKSKFAWAAKYANWFFDYAHKGADIDFAKYESFPLNAGAQVHTLMNTLRTKLKRAKSIPDVPVIIVTSEHDSTIDTQSTINLLASWHNAENRKTSSLDTLFYFGDDASLADLPLSLNRTIASCSDKSYCQQVINVAHTSVTNAASNIHYGWQGSYRNCETAFGSEHYEICKTTDNAKLGETTSENLDKHPDLQRLTFNPNFEQMTKALTDFIAKTQ